MRKEGRKGVKDGSEESETKGGREEVKEGGAWPPPGRKENQGRE